MAEINLDKNKTALLMADFSAGNMAQNPIVHERQTFERAGEVLAAARHAGIFVIYCISHFRPGYPEIPAQHNPRSPMRAAGAVLPADPALLIHPSVAPREGEPVIAKHRTSAFSGSAFETGSVANIAQGAMQGQLPLSGWELSSQGVEQFGRSEVLVSGLH